MNFGQYFKQRRMKLGYTARKFAQAKHYDVAYISRLENNIILPPGEPDKIRTLGLALELREGTKEWQDFLDLAAIARNEIPVDLHSDAVAVKLLPAFYRSLRNETLDRDEANELLDLIAKSRKE